MKDFSAAVYGDSKRVKQLHSRPKPGSQSGLKVSENIAIRRTGSECKANLSSILTPCWCGLLQLQKYINGAGLQGLGHGDDKRAQTQGLWLEQEVRWHGPVNCKLQVGVFTLLVSGGIAWPVPFGRIAHPTSPGQPRPSTPSPSPSPPRRGWTGFPPSSASSSPGDTAVHPASGVESRSLLLTCDNLSARGSIGAE